MKSPLESLKYEFIRSYDFEALEALTNKLIQIESYDLHDEKETAIVYGQIIRYKSSFGRIGGF